MIKIPRLVHMLYSYGKILPPVVVGQDGIQGRRQICIAESSDFYGKKEYFGDDVHGVGLPGGADYQIYRPDGTCEMSARYGVRLDDGRTFYFDNSGKRVIPAEMAEIVLAGGFVDPYYQYHCAVCRFETYEPSLKYLEGKMIIQTASRLPEGNRLDFWVVEIDAFEDDGITPAKAPSDNVL